MGYLVSIKQKHKERHSCPIKIGHRLTRKFLITGIKYLHIESQIGLFRAQTGKRRKSISGRRCNMIKDSNIREP